MSEMIGWALLYLLGGFLTVLRMARDTSVDIEMRKEMAIGVFVLWPFYWGAAGALCIIAAVEGVIGWYAPDEEKEEASDE